MVHAACAGDDWLGQLRYSRSTSVRAARERDGIGLPAARAWGTTLAGIGGGSLAIDVSGTTPRTPLGSIRRVERTAQVSSGRGLVDVDESRADLLGCGMTCRSTGGPIELTGAARGARERVSSLSLYGGVLRLQKRPSRLTERQ